MNGKESDDLLLGGTIVSKADVPDVRLPATLAPRRMEVLAWIKGRLEGTEPALEQVRVFYPPLTEWQDAAQV